MPTRRGYTSIYPKSAANRGVTTTDLRGKRITLTLGKYPGLGLDDARRKHLEARVKIANGINPAEEKLAQKRLIKRESGANAFARVADAWFKSKSRTALEALGTGQ